MVAVLLTCKTATFILVFALHLRPHEAFTQSADINQLVLRLHSNCIYTELTALLG